MSNKKFTPPSRYTEDIINKLTYEEIRGLSRNELVRLANAYQWQFRKRVKSFKGMYSYAAENLKKSFEDRHIEGKYLDAQGNWVEYERDIHPRFKLWSHFRANRVKTLQDDSDLRSYLRKMQNFFNPQAGSVTGIHTNTLEGIRANDRRLNGFIFGMDADGNPLYEVDQDSLKRLYDLYDEYYNSTNAAERWGYQMVYSALSILQQTGRISGGVSDYANLVSLLEAEKVGRADILGAASGNLSDMQHLVNQVLGDITEVSVDSYDGFSL